MDSAVSALEFKPLPKGWSSKHPGAKEAAPGDQSSREAMLPGCEPEVLVSSRAQCRGQAKVLSSRLFLKMGPNWKAAASLDPASNAAHLGDGGEGVGSELGFLLRQSQPDSHALSLQPTPLSLEGICTEVWVLAPMSPSSEPLWLAFLSPQDLVSTGVPAQPALGLALPQPGLSLESPAHF